MFRLVLLVFGLAFTFSSSAQQWSPLIAIVWAKVDHQGKLELQFSTTVNAACANGSLATMSNTHPNYPQVLAMGMAAVMRPRKVYAGFDSGCDTTSNIQRAKLTSLTVTSTP